MGQGGGVLRTIVHAFGWPLLLGMVATACTFAYCAVSLLRSGMLL